MAAESKTRVVNLRLENDKGNVLKPFVGSQHMTIDDPCPFFSSLGILFIVCSRSGIDPLVHCMAIYRRFSDNTYWHLLSFDKLNFYH